MADPTVEELAEIDDDLDSLFGWASVQGRLREATGHLWPDREAPLRGPARCPATCGRIVEFLSSGLPDDRPPVAGS